DAPATSGIITELQNGTPYIVQVRAVNAQGDGEWSPSSAEGIPVNVPLAPTGLALTVGDEKLTATWEAPTNTGGSDITGYAVQYREVASPAGSWLDSSNSGDSDVTDTNHDITGLTNGTEYEVRVYAVNDQGDGNPSESLTATPATVPMAPTGLALMEKDKKLTATWIAPTDNGGSDITGYEVQYREVASPAGSWLDSSNSGDSDVTDTNHDITGLTNGIEYDVRVYAVNDQGDGTPSDIAAATPDIAPALPTALTLTVGNEKLIATWAAPTDNGGTTITGYELEYKLSSGDWDTSGDVTQQTTAADTTTDTITGLTNSSEYNVRVRAVNGVNGADKGAWSNVATETPIPFSMQQATLWASTRRANDNFGYSVAVDGDTAIIGAYDGGINKGSAYVFTRSGSTWTQQQELTADDGANGDYFGYSVAVDGDTAIVGAYGDESSTGSAYVFTRSGSTWTQQPKLTADDGAGSDYFGYSVAVHGDTAIVGAWGDDSSTGSAYVFTRSGSAWTQQPKLTASDKLTSDRFGTSVAVDGNTAIVGAYRDESSTGSAYVFTRSGSAWPPQQQKLTADDDGAINDNFGISVAVDGNTAIVGAYGDESSTGSAYVFTRSSSTWTRQQKLTADDGAASDWFGYSVAVDEDTDTAIVGAYQDESSTGSAYVFTRSSSTWTEQKKLTADDGADEDSFGTSVAVDGDTAIVGAYGTDASNTKLNAGSAYIFVR
ncbi:MAG: fibronectin type III domain-containing protein, partial [Salinispira sp.]